MSVSTTPRTRWTTSDIALLPDNGTRYEIIDGELYMSRQPHWHHQRTCGNVYVELRAWSPTSGLGQACMTPGVLFTGAPELAVEVLSPGVENERRDREAKLKLYESRGVREYWIVDWRLQQLEVYRRDQAMLRLVATLFTEDVLTSPLLPGFSCPVARLFT